MRFENARICANCKHWTKRDDSLTMGMCSRFPPGCHYRDNCDRCRAFKRKGEDQFRDDRKLMNTDRNG